MADHFNFSVDSSADHRGAADHSRGHLIEDRTKTTVHNYNAQHLRFYRRAGLRRWSLRFNGDEDVDAVPLSSCHFSSICL